MKIGDKRILVSLDFYLEFLNARTAINSLPKIVGNVSYKIILPKKEVVVVKITTKIHNVREELTGQPQESGYLGIGSDGYKYSFNYPVYSEGANGTIIRRYCSDEQYNLFSDADKKNFTDRYRWKDIDSLSNLPNPIFSQLVLDFCPIHGCHFYVEEDRCFECAFEARQRQQDQRHFMVSNGTQDT
jgi:hypothetical protein